MGKYVSFDNLSRYDGKIKEYIEEHSGGSSDYEIGNLKAYDHHTAETALVLENLKPGVYILYTNGSFDIHFKALESSSGTQHISVNKSNDKLILILTQVPAVGLGDWDILGTIITNSIGFSNSAVYTTNYMLYYKTSDNGNMSFETVQSETSATIADIDTAQTISGKKTFSTLPESSVVPTTDDQLTNKKYVDDTVSNIGDVNQYFITGNSSSNPFIFKGKKKGVYHFIDKKPGDNIYYKFDTSNSNTSDPLVPLEINILKDINGTEANGTPLGYYTKAGMSFRPFSSVYCVEIKRGTSSSTGLSTGIPSNGSIQYVTVEHAQTISSEKTFSTLPKSTVVPTDDAHLVNKKYVDDNSVKLITTNTNIWELAHGVYKVEAGVQLNYKPTSSGYITVGNYGTFLFVSKASNGSVPFYLLGRSVTNNTRNEMYIGVAQNNTYGICDVYNLGNIELAVTTTDNQTIYGVKNFYVLPESSVVPTTNNQLVNKKYVDDSIPTKTSDLTNDSGFMNGLFIATYGTTTLTEVKAAVEANKIVYCRVNSRYAFLAYGSGNNYEFQYYRSNTTHSYNNGDSVFVYKIDSSGWTTTERKTEARPVNSTSTTVSNSGSNETYYINVKNDVVAYWTDLFSTLGVEIYSMANTYSVGDYVYHSVSTSVVPKIYRCKTAVTTAGAFDSTYWEESTYKNFIQEITVGAALGGSY